MLKNFDFGTLVRAATLGIRFLLPILILALATQEELGRYYLFAAAIALVVFFGTFELNIFFAKSYIEARSADLIFHHFKALLTATLFLYAVLGTPALLCFLWWTEENNPLLYCGVIFYASTEIVANEHGRFLTNINHVRNVIFRDLYRAACVVLAGLLSLTLSRRIVSWEYFSILGILNATLIVVEYFIAKRSVTEPVSSQDLRDQVRSAICAIRQTRGAVAESGILYLYPLLERMVLERTVGLAVVGGYAFFSSIIQAALSVIFLPTIAKFRSLVLQMPASARRESAPMVQGLLAFLLKLFGIGLAVVFLLQLADQLDFSTTRITFDPWFSMAALTCVAASNLIYIVSPDFARPGKELSAAVTTAMIYACSLSFALLCFFWVTSNPAAIASILGAGGLLQLLVRKQYLCTN